MVVVVVPPGGLILGVRGPCAFVGFRDQRSIGVWLLVFTLRRCRA